MTDDADRQPEPAQPVLLRRLLAPAGSATPSQIVDELGLADRARDDPRRPFVILNMTGTVDGRSGAVSEDSGASGERASGELSASLRRAADAVIADDGVARLRADGSTVPVAHDERTDLHATLAELAQRHHVGMLLCDGATPLSMRLLDAGLVDELLISLSPTLVGGDEVIKAAATPGDAGLERPIELELLGAFECGSQLFLRYGVRA